MTEPASSERDLTTLLDKAVQQATFLVPDLVGFSRAGLQCTGSQLRETFYTNSGYARMQLVRAQAKLAEADLSELATALHTHLKCYVVDDHIGNGLALMIGGIPRPSMSDYALYLVRAAAFLGAERVAHLLSGWARGEPLHYNTCMVLSSLSIDEAMSMDGGIHFNMLPKSSDGLTNELPFGADFDMGVMNMAGATKVAIECQDYPVLFRSDEWPDIQTATYGSSRDFLYAEFCAALGLACNCNVSWIMTWRDFDELAIFGNGTASGHTTGPETRFYSAGPPVSQEQLDHAGDLLTELRTTSSPSIEIPMHRWMSSKRPSASLADRFVDLRIALESLYLSESGPELSFRLATHGAWHLGANFDERQSYYKILRDAYRTASTAVHKGIVTDTRTSRKILTDAQDLCRLGILKRLGEGDEPEWNALILGKELGTAAMNDAEAHP